MDLGDQPQPLVQLQPTYHPYQHHISDMIEPCAIRYDKLGNPKPAIFHLLSCGHIVAVYNGESSCARNCQHAAVLGTTVSHPLPRTTIQNTDLLHCETCIGIPIDRFQCIQKIIQHELGQYWPPKDRRVGFAITSPMLQVVFSMDEIQIHNILRSPYFDTKHQAFDWKYIHSLRCGHSVWCPFVRPCASNCTDDAVCHVANLPDYGRTGDAIICQECVSRTELMLRRWKVAEEDKGYNHDSGYTTDGPRSTSSTVTEEENNNASKVGDLHDANRTLAEALRAFLEE